MSRDSSVGIATGYELDDPGGIKDFSLLHRVQIGCETYPRFLSSVNRGALPGDNAAGKLS
jgi:hypothetical protein